jgi:hypothetical protein
VKGSRNRMGVRLRGSPVSPGVPGGQTVGPVADRRRTGPAQRRAERNKSYFKWAVAQGAFRWSVERTIGSSNCVMARQGWNASLCTNSAVTEAPGRLALGAARRARVVSEEAARPSRAISEEAARRARVVSEEAARPSRAISEETARRARVVSEEAARRESGQRRGRSAREEGQRRGRSASGRSQRRGRLPRRAGAAVAGLPGLRSRAEQLAEPSKRRKRRAAQISRRGVPGNVDKRFEMEEKAGPFSVTAVR